MKIITKKNYNKMKTATFFWKTAATLTATMLLLLALAIAFASCNKDDDDKNNEELYTPQQDMTSNEILTLIEEVRDNMATVRQVAMEAKETEISDGETYQGVFIGKADLDAKKMVTEEYQDGTIIYFSYVENLTSYFYEKYDGSREWKESYKVSDAYWNRGADFAVDGIDDAFDLEWKVEGSTFVGSYGSEVKMTVTLTKDKKLVSVKVEYRDSKGAATGGLEVKYAYSGVNPAFPSGFSKSDFPLASQYSVKVVWGEGLGESTFYADGEYLYPHDITDYAPKVQGKTPTLYFDSQFTQAFTSSKVVSNNNLVIYVKWVASTSGSRSAGRPAAKSLLKKLS